MKTIRMTQMQSFEATSLHELNEKFNATMAWVGRTARRYEQPVVDLSLLRGYVIYESVETIPEGIKDILQLNGVTPTCSECVKYEPCDFKSGSCKHCRGRLLNDDEVCNKFYMLWESGESWFKDEEEKKYERYLKERGCKSVRSA